MGASFEISFSELILKRVNGTFIHDKEKGVVRVACEDYCRFVYSRTHVTGIRSPGTYEKTKTR